jgi:hypothetical protein
LSAFRNGAYAAGDTTEASRTALLMIATAIRANTRWFWDGHCCPLVGRGFAHCARSTLREVAARTSVI